LKKRLKEIIHSFKDQCDYLEIRLEESETLHIHFSGHTLEEVGSNMEKGGFIRALYKGGWGEVSFNDYESLEEYIKTAIKQAKLVGKSESSLAAVPVIEDEVLLDLKHDPRQIPLDQKISLLQGYNSIVLHYHELIKSSVVRYTEQFVFKTFANSEGSYIYQERMDVNGVVAALSQKGEASQMGSVSYGSTNDYHVLLGLEEEIQKSCRLAVDLLSASKPKGGQYTVITDPMLTGVFVHEAFGHLSEADSVYEDENLQKLMQFGAELGSGILNIYDSGTIEGTRGHLKYDDEGVRTERTYLIKEGKLAGRLHSRETAGKMKERPTGSARALSYKFPPICRMRSTCIEAGHALLEDMIKDIELGIIAYKATGGETNGEMFTFSPAYAYMIRNGKIAELIRDVNLSGNVFTTLKNIDMISSSEQVTDGSGGCGKGLQFPLPVSMGGPFIRIQNVIVGGDE
jgi:TldD protein